MVWLIDFFCLKLLNLFWNVIFSFSFWNWLFFTFIYRTPLAFFFLLFRLWLIFVFLLTFCFWFCSWSSFIINSLTRFRTTSWFLDLFCFAILPWRIWFIFMKSLFWRVFRLRLLYFWRNLVIILVVLLTADTKSRQNHSFVELIVLTIFLFIPIRDMSHILKLKTPLNILISTIFCFLAFRPVILFLYFKEVALHV